MYSIVAQFEDEQIIGRLVGERERAIDGHLSANTRRKHDALGVGGVLGQEEGLTRRMEGVAYARYAQASRGKNKQRIGVRHCPCSTRA